MTSLFARLGFLIDFLSHAAVVGFMGGAAITIALQQLKGFLGIKKFTKKTDIISVMKSVWGSVHHGVCIFSFSLSISSIFPEDETLTYVRLFPIDLQWNWQTILIGASFLAFLLLAKYIVSKFSSCFRVNIVKICHHFLESNEILLYIRGRKIRNSFGYLQLLH